MAFVPPFSLLMAVYRGDRLDDVKLAVRSNTVTQQLPPTQLVVVRDGPVASSIQAFLDDLSRWLQEQFERAGNAEITVFDSNDTVVKPTVRGLEVTVVKLEANHGLAHALNAGLRHCRYDIVARADSDDASRPERFAVQIPLLAGGKARGCTDGSADGGSADSANPGSGKNDSQKRNFRHGQVFSGEAVGGESATDKADLPGSTGQSGYDLVGSAIQEFTSLGPTSTAMFDIGMIEQRDSAEQWRNEELITGIVETGDVVDENPHWCDVRERFLHPRQIRRLPSGGVELQRFARIQSPLNHPSVVFRKQAVLAVGGYPEQAGRFEDYLLWERMMLNGAGLHNVADPLVLYRVDLGAYERRGGWSMFRDELRLQRVFRCDGFTSWPQWFRNVLVRAVYRLMPERLRRFGYRALTRWRSGAGISVFGLRGARGRK